MYVNQDVLLSFVRNVLHMCEQTIIIMLFFLGHKKLPGTRLTHPLPSGATHPLDNSQITQWGGITIQVYAPHTTNKHKHTLRLWA